MTERKTSKKSIFTRSKYEHLDWVADKLAEVAHNIWSKWYIHMRDNWTDENRVRWDRQSMTEYKNLTPKEKEKDRMIAWAYIARCRSSKPQTRSRNWKWARCLR